MRQDLGVIYNHIKICKVCGLKYGTDNKGEQDINTCPVCVLGHAFVKKIVKRKKEMGI